MVYGVAQKWLQITDCKDRSHCIASLGVTGVITIQFLSRGVMHTQINKLINR